MFEEEDDCDDNNPHLTIPEVTNPKWNSSLE